MVGCVHFVVAVQFFSFKNSLSIHAIYCANEVKNDSTQKINEKKKIIDVGIAINVYINKSNMEEKKLYTNVSSDELHENLFVRSEAKKNCILIDMR